MYINDLNNEEFYGEDIIKNKIIGVISGCYCPPHKGHFFTWYTVCKDLNLDILFITSQNVPAIKKTKNGYKRNFLSRHGIPIEFTEWVVSKWAHQLTNADNKPVTVIFSNNNPLFRISNDFKQLYLISFGEGKSNNKDENEEQKIAWLETLDKTGKGDFGDVDVSYWGRKNKIIQGKNNEVGSYPVYRISNKNYWRNSTNIGADSPSATKFTKCLNNTKHFLLSGIDKKRDCFNYLPDFMSHDDKYEYIDKIMDEYYTESSYAECIAQYPNELEICDIYNFIVNGGNKNNKNKNKKNNKKIVKTSTREKKHTNRKKYTKKNKKKNIQREINTKRNKYKEK